MDPEVALSTWATGRLATASALGCVEPPHAASRSTGAANKVFKAYFPTRGFGEKLHAHQAGGYREIYRYPRSFRDRDERPARQARSKVLLTIVIIDRFGRGVA